MVSHEVLILCLVFTTGLLSGVVYFWGIWKSIQRYQQYQNTTVFVLGALLRLALLLLFLWFVARNDMTKYFVFFSGFLISKYIAVKISKSAKNLLKLNHRKGMSK